MYNVKCFILLLALQPTVFAKKDYCKSSLCKYGEEHISCNNTGDFSPRCQNPIMLMTRDIRKLIVNKHNFLRNEIANGFNNFPFAKKMPAMKWNNKLARLAEYNLKRCEYSHDQCRNTKRFPKTGQNIAFNWWSGFTRNVTEVIDEQIQAWFDEYKICPKSIIKKFVDTGLDILHFTVMVNEKATHLGCAVIRYDENNGIKQLIACNYAYTNMISEPVYTEGPTASKCSNGTHKVFTSLCIVRNSNKNRGNRFPNSNLNKPNLSYNNGGSNRHYNFRGRNHDRRNPNNPNRNYYNIDVNKPNLSYNNGGSNRHYNFRGRNHDRRNSNNPNRNYYNIDVNKPNRSHNYGASNRYNNFRGQNPHIRIINRRINNRHYNFRENL